MDSPPKTNAATDFAAINEEWFRAQSAAEFVEGSPHLKHPRLRDLCLIWARETLEKVARPGIRPAVLDMGAGDGMLTMPFLRWGAEVVAADSTPKLLTALEQRAQTYAGALTTATGDIFATLDNLAKAQRRFDIISASSFLHHIPDYLELFRSASRVLAEGGCFFTFQDPLRYDSLSRTTFRLDRLSYFGWRLLQGNLLRGFKTRWRRWRGIYCTDLPEDSAEYHVVRNGVDQDAIRTLLTQLGCTCEIRSYWSTQSRFFQAVGEKLGRQNTFAVIAQKTSRVRL